MLPATELRCRERLQIRVSKRLSESDQNESDESESFQSY